MLTQHDIERGLRDLGLDICEDCDRCRAHRSRVPV
jgi:hypothetical protein